MSKREETRAEHIARDMQEGRFPDQSPRQMVDDVPEITAWQVAYAALWQIQSSTPALHDARKHLLTVIGGSGSDGQRAALSWAFKHLPEPMNLDMTEAAECWGEADSQE